VATCPYCAADLPDGAAACPECGRGLAPPAPAPAEAPTPLRVVGGLGCVVLGALAALLAVVVLFGVLAGGLLG
jgi:hypothetical protein